MMTMAIATSMAEAVCTWGIKRVHGAIKTYYIRKQLANDVADFVDNNALGDFTLDIHPLGHGFHLSSSSMFEYDITEGIELKSDVVEYVNDKLTYESIDTFSKSKDFMFALIEGEVFAIADMSQIFEIYEEI
jgi:hypothetical protein